MEKPRILVVNLGASSSKYAVFAGSECLHFANIPVDNEVAKSALGDQEPYRLKQLEQFLEGLGEAGKGINAVSARGGITKPLSCRGVYRVDSELLSDLASERYGSHPSNLSARIAQAWADGQPKKLPVFIVDPVGVDTLWDEARMSGVPEVSRKGRHHALNVQQAAHEAARRLGKPLFRCRMVVGHFGSGVSICSMWGGRVVDVNDAQLGEGPFSVARAGTLPISGLLDLAYAEPDRKKLETFLAREAGLSAYVGTADFERIEEMLDDGDAKAGQAYEAMVFQSAKYLAAAAGALGERIDCFVLTGGLAQSKRFVRHVSKRIEWIARVEVVPGEDEMLALATGADLVLAGYEPQLRYAEVETSAKAPPGNFHEVKARAAQQKDCCFVVAGSASPEIAETVRLCHRHGIHGFTLVGSASEISALLEAEGVPLAEVKVVDSNNVEADAIRIVQSNPRSVLVKGQCSTAKLLKAVLACLPEGESHFLSHIAVIENPFIDKLILVTDGGLNLAPDCQQKISIMENALAMARALGVNKPHVLLAAGMEDKGQDVAAITDAREIVRLHREAGRWAESVIDGPFGMDVAFSSQAAMLKGIKSAVAGRSEIVVAPNLESANFAVKMATFYSNRPWGGLVLGGPFPVVIGSRSDDAETRLCSIALAQLVAAGMEDRQLLLK